VDEDRLTVTDRLVDPCRRDVGVRERAGGMQVVEEGA
jgi:hypothetical protein